MILSYILGVVAMAACTIAVAQPWQDDCENPGVILGIVVVTALLWPVTMVATLVVAVAWHGGHR